MKIPILEAISSGDWLHCSTNIGDGDLLFRLRPTSFKLVPFSAIDDPHNLRTCEGVLWILKIEVVNLCKTQFPASYLRCSVVLIDKDEFIFNTWNDAHLTYLSDFSKQSGLIRFSDLDQPLSPKIKASGAISFLLPDDDHADYFLSVVGGNIQSV